MVFPNHKSHGFQRSATLSWRQSELFCKLIKKTPHPTKTVRKGQLSCMPVMVGLIFPGRELMCPLGEGMRGLGTENKKPNKTHLQKKKKKIPGGIVVDS